MNSTALLLLLLPLTLLAQDGFEQPPTFSAATILKPELAAGVALSGDASPMVQQKLKDAGIMLATRLAPGPLQ